MMHLDIKNERIWIQQNTTQVDIATELVEMGVPKQDIVIGFHTPKMHQLTDFTVLIDYKVRYTSMHLIRVRISLN